MGTKNTGGKKLILNSIIYSLNGVLIKCFSFFLLPIYTAYLTTADYGVMNLSSSFLNTLGFIVTFSLFSAIMRFYVDLKDDAEKLKRFYGTLILFVFASSVVWTLLFILLRNPLSKYVFSGIDFFPVVFVSVLTIMFYCQHQVYDNILKSQQKAFKSSVLSLCYFLVTISLNILFVVKYRMGAFGVVTATFISSELYTLFFIIDVTRQKSVKWCIDLPLLKKALKYSIPIIPHNLSSRIAVLVSQVLIGGTSTLSSLGIYSIAAQFGSISDVVQSYVNQAYGPWLYEKLHEKKDNYKSEIRELVKMLSMVIAFFMLGITLFAEEYVLLFLHESYVGACKYIPFTVLVYVIKIPYYFFINVLFYYKKASRMIFVSTLSSSFINLLLSSILIPKYSVAGSLFADCISMIITVSIVICISTRFESTGVQLRDLIKAIVIYAVFAVIGMLPSILTFNGTFRVYIFIYKVIVILIYLAVLVIMYHKQIKKLFNKVVKK